MGRWRSIVQEIERATRLERDRPLLQNINKWKAPPRRIEAGGGPPSALRLSKYAPRKKPALGGGTVDDLEGGKWLPRGALESKGESPPAPVQGVGESELVYDQGGRERVRRPPNQLKIQRKRGGREGRHGAER